MPAANAKTIKRRIKSVSNTRKITKAMELVAASKMRRAVNAVLATRAFAQLSWATISAVSQATGEAVSHPLLKENTQAKKSLVILFTSDRGLAGALNVNMIRLATKAIQEAGDDVDVIAVGRRGANALQKRKVSVIASFEGLTNKPVYKDILSISNLILSEYSKGTYKKVIIAYTDFISALTQKPKLIELLPLGTPEAMSELGHAEEETKGVAKEETEKIKAEKSNALEYVFEPDPQQVIDSILPRLIETMVYQALLESAASEHSARMMAMRNASDAANDMLNELTFTYNQIRQAGITREIAEISSGKAAIE